MSTQDDNQFWGNRMKYIYLLVSVILGIYYPVLDASAQQTNDENTSSGQLEEIIVTAQKRQENVQDVGVSITAFSSKAIQELGLSRAEDIGPYVPGLTISNTFGNSFPVFSLRGAGMEVFDANQNTTVGTYFDEVYVTSPVILANQMFDVEHIEVVKGPQGTLYGRNSSGGAVNIRSTRPTDEFGGFLTTSIGNFGRYGLEFAFGGPISDTFKYRVSSKMVDDDGYQDNSFTGGELATTEQQAIRFLGNWTPSDRVDVMFNIHAGKDNSKLVGPKHFNTRDFSNPGGAGCSAIADGVSIEGIREQQLCSDRFGNTEAEIDPNLSDVHSIPIETPIDLDNEAFGASVTINWNLSDTLLLTSITALETFDRFQREDFDGGAGVDGFNGIPEGGSGMGDDRGFDIIPTRRKEDFDMVTQELRLTSNFDGRLNYVAGFYYFQDEIDSANEYDGSGATPSRTDIAPFIQERTSTAIFGQLGFDLTEAMKLTLALRYTDDDVDFDGYTDRYNAQLPRGSEILLDPVCRFAGTVQPAPGQVFCNEQGPTNPNNVPNVNNFSDENTSYRVALDWAPSENSLLYASVSTGYKSGGFNGNTGRDFGAYTPFESEEIVSTAFGLKSEWLDRTLQVNAEIFQYDYDGLQARLFLQDAAGDFFTQFVNVDNSEVDGLEVESTWLPSENWLVKASYSYLDAVYGDVLDDSGNPTQVGDNALGPAFAEFFGGKQIIRSPEHSWNTLIRYQRAISASKDLAFQIDYSWQDDKRLQSNVYSDTASQEAHGILGARVSIFSSGDGWDISLWGKNLLDEDVLTHTFIFSLNGLAYYAPPRTYGVDVSFNF